MLRHTRNYVVEGRSEDISLRIYVGYYTIATPDVEIALFAGSITAPFR